MTKMMKAFLIVLLAATAITATAASSSNEKIIAVPGSSLTLKLWVDGQNGAMYDIINNGQVLRTAPANYELGLMNTHFDPLKGLPSIPSIMAADGSEHLYVVQFVTQPLGEFQNDITRLGGHVRQYVAQFAFLVEMNEAVKAQVANLPYVRWIGSYQPAFRLDPQIRTNLINSGLEFAAQHYNIQVLDVAQKAIVADRLNSIGAIVNVADAGRYIVEATLTPEQILEVARWDEVNFIDIWGPYEADMDIWRQIAGINYVEGLTGFSGEDVRGETFDQGFQTAHQDFQLHPLIQHGTIALDAHGTACNGINFGTGAGNAQARGQLPDGQGIVAVYQTWGLSGANRAVEDMQLLQAPYQVVFQTSSVGSPQITTYTTISAEADGWCFNSDLVHCQSQSNMGNQNSRPQAWAKNMSSGGAIIHYNTLSRADDMWGGGASIGPASDGRIKPTLIGFYDNVWTTYSTATNGYGQFSGTSSGTPMTAGCYGLFFQMWDAAIFGNTVIPGGSVFQNRCHSSTARAFLIATAYQYPFTGTTGDKIRTHQGWGMPDMQYLYDHRAKFLVVDESVVLQNLQNHQHTFTVNPSEPELKIAMVYSDLPGNPAIQTQHRINDLSLKVTSPSGTVYWGNNGLYSGNWSVAGGVADTKNTEECVFVQNPPAGQWTATIYADEVIQDAHVETPGVIDADYALVVCGVASINLNLDVNVVPVNPPIVIPANGGNFSFNISVTNLGPSMLPYTVWGRIKNPDGTYTPPTLGPVNINTPVGTPITRLRTQSVPASWAPGAYSFIAYAGMFFGYPAIDSSSFGFTKSPVADGGPIVMDATNWGESFSEEMDPTTPPPSAFELKGATPNPFNPITTISFTMPQTTRVKLAVYDVQGRLVATLLDGMREAGSHQVTFNGSNLASGIYLYRIEAGAYNAVGKMVLMK